MFIFVHSFSVQNRNKNKTKKVKPRTCVCMCGSVWGYGPLQLKKDDNRFYFQGLGLILQNRTQNPLPISWILCLNFIRFQDSRKFQCESHSHMKCLMCYLFSGLKMTARNSQNAIKESPPKASQTQKIVPPPTEASARVWPWTHKAADWPLAQLEPPSTLMSGSGPGPSSTGILADLSAVLPILIYISLWIDCLFEIRKIAVCYPWLSMPGDYRVTDEALLAETT